MKKNYSLKHFISHECTNYHGENQCYGAGLTNIKGLGPVPAPKAGKCIVLEAQGQPIDKRKQCIYFEKCLLPLPGKGRVEYTEACRKHQYLYRAISSPVMTVKEIRQCKCGDPLAQRRRMCDKCRREQDLEAKKKYKREKKLRAGRELTKLAL